MTTQKNKSSFFPNTALASLVLALCLLVTTKALAQQQHKAKFMINMQQAQEVQQWRTLNDNVMGGVSQSSIVFNQDHGLFSGEVSLANNGGFSSITRAIPALAETLSEVEIKVLGDGKHYQLRFAVWLNGYRVNYKQSFATQAGKSQTFRFNLDQFTASYRGRDIANAPVLKPEYISEVGFLISNKVAETFALRIYQLEFK